jgi:hypothetical protein
LSWPFASVLAGAGLDNSWEVGLNMAVAHGLTFGQQVIFTYGPLGFSYSPTAITPGTFLTAEVLGGLMQLALVAVLLANLRRRMSWIAAILLTLIAASIEGQTGAEPLTAIVFGLVVLTLTTPAPRAERAFRMLAIGGGALAGFALTVKLNDGVAVSAILAVSLLGGDARRRNLAVAAGTLLGTLVTLWLIVGEPLGALPDYLRNGYEVIVGYVEAMGHNRVGADGEWQVWVVLGSAVALSVGAWSALSAARLRQRASLVGAVVLVHYFLAREMFVRYDSGHVAFIALLVPVALMIPWTRAQRATGMALACILALATFAVLDRSVGEVVDPLGHATQLVDQAGDVLQPAAPIAEGRESVRLADGLPSATARALRGHCVNAEPVEIAAVWAHPAWRWCPLPVFQSYSAYTPRLDRLNAAAYADARHGPDRVLRQIHAIDGRNPTWESPAAMLSLLCHFTEIEHTEVFQTLARVPDRCGAERTIAVIHSSLGRTIALPPPPEGAVMVASIDGLQVAGWERLETLFTRAEPRYVMVNQTTYRVPPGTADDGLVLAVPTDADYPAPFNFNMSPHLLRVTVDGHSSGPIAVRLSAIPIAPLPAAPATASAASQSFRPDTHHLPWVYEGQQLLAPKQILSLPEEDRELADSALLIAESYPFEKPSAKALRAAVPAVLFHRSSGMSAHPTPVAGTSHGCTLLTPSASGAFAVVKVAPGQGLYLNMAAKGLVSLYLHRYASHVPAQPLFVLPNAGTPAVLPFPSDDSTLPWRIRLAPTTPTAVCVV